MHSQDEFKRVIFVLEDAILATDLAIYFRRRSETFAVIDDDLLDWGNDAHRSLLRGMMMTGCDLSAITKPWPIQQKVARLITDEFLYQGDLEKSQLRLQPVDGMDRDKMDRLPALQVDFIDSLCLPAYRALAKLTDTLQPVLDGCLDNRKEWERLAKAGGANCGDGGGGAAEGDEEGERD